MATGTTARRAVVENERLWRVLLALTPATIYLAGRVLSVWVLRWIADLRGKDFVEAMGAWDGRHFIAIAESGYTWTTDAKAVASPAFFPLMPRLMSLVGWLLNCSERTAGLLISAVAGVIAAYGLVRLAEFVPGLARGGGLILVAVFSVAPMSTVLSMSYSEALFCAPAVWALVFLLRGNWLAAGGLAVVAGLVRPTGLALAGTIVIAAVVVVVRRRADWTVYVGAVVAPLGFLAYVGYVGWRLGSPTAWFALQRTGWHSEFDWGAGTLRFLMRTARDAPALLDVATVLLLIGAVVLFAVSIAQRQPYELLCYSALVLIQVLGSDGVMNSKGRLLIASFTLLIPVAVMLNRQRRGWAIAALVVGGLVSAWYGAYAVIIYGYAF